MRNRVLTLLCIFGVTSAQADVTESTTYIHYDVGLEAGQSLTAAVNQSSPHRTGSRIMHGRTDWHVSWRFRWDNSVKGRCAFTSVSTALRTTISLPRLNTRDAKSLQRFDAYLAKLKEHELGHLRIARNAAQAIDRGILSLAPESTCAKASAKANALGQRLLKEASAEEIQYDASTDHGRTQGAWLTDS